MPTIKRGNPKAFEKINLRLAQLDGAQSKVGWFETAKYQNGTPVAMAAAANELGHGSTPPRPFFRPTILRDALAWTKTAAEGARAVIRGNATMTQVMEAIGQQAEAGVAKSIEEVTTPPLSPVTIELRAMKQRNPSLVVTAQTVGQAAARVKAPGYKPPTGISTKPLNDTGLMIETLTSVTETTS